MNGFAALVAATWKTLALIVPRLFVVSAAIWGTAELWNRGYLTFRHSLAAAILIFLILVISETFTTRRAMKEVERKNQKSRLETLGDEAADEIKKRKK